jgi:enoyl-CoA hydratase/carnithine racemase
MPVHERRRDDGAREWAITNPRRRNAIDPDGLRWITGTCPDLRGEVVVLRGAGDDPFCAGFDLTQLQPQPDELPDAVLARATAAMVAADATFVAAVGGYAIGAGVELLASCDIVVAQQDAWLRVPVAQIGVVYHADGLRRIAATFGPAVTQRLLLLNEKVPASQAIGAIAHLTSASDLESAVAEVVASLQRAAPASTRGHRRFLRALRAGQPLDGPFLESHEEARRAAYTSADHAAARAGGAAASVGNDGSDSGST